MKKTYALLTLRAAITLLVLSGLAWTSATPRFAHAATFTVNSTADAADANPGDGVCETAPGNGVCTLRAAIQETNALAGADNVNVPAGLYTLALAGANENAAATGDLDILDDLMLTGTDAATTIIDGAGLDRIFDIAPSGFGDPTPSIDVVISGVTVRGGEAAGGGGIRYASRLKVKNAVISDNVSTLGGGGFSSTNNIFDEPRLTLIDSVVENNRAPFFGGDGGGIDAESSTSLLITRSIIRNNEAVFSGGGISASGVAEQPVLTEVTITGNTAGPSIFGIGGGLNGGCFIITRSTISGNSSSENGGGLQNTGNCGATITNSTISGNTSGTRGGGVANSGSLELVHITIADNTADNPGAEPTGAGGGIFQFGVGSSTVLQNTIVANNATDNCGGVPVTSLGNNITSDGSCNLTEPSDLLNTNPLLGPLADNGGLTQTQALLAGSPAIDAAAGAGLAVDQRGFPRPADGDGDATADSDIGAFEFGAVPPLVDETSPVCDIQAINMGPPVNLDVFIQDAESGVASIEVLKSRNATVEIPKGSGNFFNQGDVVGFTPPETDAFLMHGVKVDPGRGSTIAIKVTDAAGNETVCDPIVATVTAEVPEAFRLEQNYPNPFNPTTTIRFAVAEPAHVTLAIYDVLGRKVATLVDQAMEPGTYAAEWDGTNDAGLAVAGGTYLYRLTAGTFTQTKTMTLLK